MTKFDPTKPVQTRGGLPVRIICTDRKHPSYPVIGLALVDGIENTVYTTKEGKYNCRPQDGDTEYDLVNIPQRRPHADLIIAWANGAKIEYFDSVSEQWFETDKPQWNPDRKYRITPEQE
jgi:hypothetical protein